MRKKCNLKEYNEVVILHKHLNIIILCWAQLNVFICACKRKTFASKSLKMTMKSWNRRKCSVE